MVAILQTKQAGLGHWAKTSFWFLTSFFHIDSLLLSKLTVPPVSSAKLTRVVGIRRLTCNDVRKGIKKENQLFSHFMRGLYHVPSPPPTPMECYGMEHVLGLSVFKRTLSQNKFFSFLKDITFLNIIHTSWKFCLSHRSALKTLIKLELSDKRDPRNRQQFPITDPRNKQRVSCNGSKNQATILR